MVAKNMLRCTPSSLRVPWGDDLRAYCRYLNEPNTMPCDDRPIPAQSFAVEVADAGVNTGKPFVCQRPRVHDPIMIRRDRNKSIMPRRRFDALWTTL